MMPFERREPFEEARGDVDAGDVLLDEQPLGVGGKHVFDHPASSVGSSTTEACVIPLDEPS